MIFDTILNLVTTYQDSSIRATWS